MSFLLVTLSSFVEIKKGKKHEPCAQPSELARRFLQIDDLRNDNNIKYTLDEKGVYATKNDVIIAWDGANAGTIGFGKEGLIGSTLAKLTFNTKKINTEYLGLFLQSKFRELRENCTGATIPHINKAFLVSLKIPLPPLETQKQIAAVLEKADQLRKDCKLLEQELNSLAQSVFIEMFGDPVTNPKGWKVKPLIEILLSKPQIGTTKPSHSDGVQKVVRVGELGGREVNYGKCGAITLEGKDFERYRLFEGDFLLARAIGSRSHLGKASLFIEQDTDYVYDSHVMRLRFNSNIMSSKFYYELMKTDGGRTLFLNSSSQTAVQFNINAKQASLINLPVPPLDLQDKYLKFVKKMKGLHSSNTQLTKEYEDSFNSLMQKAFSGELNLANAKT